MLEISNELRELYKTDNVPKELILEFPDIGLTITNDKIVSESFALSENLCSDPDLEFGNCEAAMIEVTIANIAQDITGQRLVVTQIVDGVHRMPLGTYWVESAKLQDNRKFKDIQAYDAMRKFDIDVSDWYNSLMFPLTVKQMRHSLCEYVGVEMEEQTLPNDHVLIEQTIEPTGLAGRATVLWCLAEINGGFGHITRLNKLKMINLGNIGLYPSESLYPSEDLFPAESTEIMGDSTDPFRSSYRSIVYEEYVVRPIDKLQIRQEEGDIGAIIGEGDNPYIMQGNFLVYGKSVEELREIGERIFLQIKNKFYRPHTTVMAGLPYLEVGDSVAIITRTDVIETFIFNRYMTGIQALKDEISAQGEEKRENQIGILAEIKQLKGKSAVLIRTAEELSNTMKDLEEDVESQFKQTAKDIELRVKSDEVINFINVSKEGVKINANRLDIQGYVTFSDLKNEGQTVINGGNITTGKIYGDYIEGGTIKGARLYSEYKRDVGTVTLEMSDEAFRAELAITENIRRNVSLDYAGINFGGVGNQTKYKRDGIELNKFTVDENGNVSCNRLNNGTPITSSNINSQSVNYASSAKTADSASTLSGAVYISGNGNFRPVSDVNGSCGTSAGRWSSIWSLNGNIQTSDRSKKEDIKELDERYTFFAQRLTGLPRTYKMKEGTSGRTHVGLIAQDIEQVMEECGISDMEFAGLVKSPVYERVLENGEYDEESKIKGYDYYLRYDEFIPLILAVLRNKNEIVERLEKRLVLIEEKLNSNY